MLALPDRSLGARIHPPALNNRLAVDALARRRVGCFIGDYRDGGEEQPISCNAALKLSLPFRVPRGILGESSVSEERGLAVMWLMKNPESHCDTTR